MDHLMHQVHHYLDKATSSQWQMPLNQPNPPRIDGVLMCMVQAPSRTLLIIVLLTSLIPIVTGVFGFIVSANLRKQQTVK